MLRGAIIVALVVFIAIPAATALFQFGAVALSILMNQSPTPEKQELIAVSEKYRGVQGPKHSEQALLSIDHFQDFLPTRLTSVQILFEPQRFGSGPLADQLRAARIAAPQYVKDECKALLKSFASQCRLSEVSVSPSQGTLEMRMRLQFIQRGDFGELPPLSQSQLDVAHLEYGSDADPLVALRSEGAASARRSKIYAAIAKDCEATRSAYGNCSIQGVRISASAFGRKNTLKIATTGSATLASISPAE